VIKLSSIIWLNQDTIISSDWHVLHRNIYWFLPEARKIISDTENTTRLSYPEFIEAEVRTYRKIFDLIRDTVEKHSIRRFYFLGDLVFGLNKRRESIKKLEVLNEEVPVFFDIFKYLESKKIERKMILGNHDDFQLQNVETRAFYESIFDEISLFICEGNNLYTHFPLGYSNAYDQSCGTPEEKFFRINKVFYKLDKKLLRETKGSQITNFHGHIHTSEFCLHVENVSHHNMAIDWRVSAIAK
jgi:calcineurin-like phosphoesterase family protein